MPDDKDKFERVAREIVDKLLGEPRCLHEIVDTSAKAEPIAAILRREFGEKLNLLARATEALDRLEIEMRPALSPDGHCYWVVRATHGQAEFIRKVREELKNAHKD